MCRGGFCLSEVSSIVKFSPIEIPSYGHKTVVFMFENAANQNTISNKYLVLIEQLLGIFTKIILVSFIDVRPGHIIRYKFFYHFSENNKIKIWNNGKGIPVVEHKTEKMYVPTMIFGHLLTSSNYDDSERKVTGKLCI